MSSYDVGDRARLTLALTDVTGVAADGTVVLTVTSPSNVASTPSVTHGVTGAYYADVDLDAEGRWYYRWVSTGAVVASESGVLEVRPAAAPGIVSLAEAKAHLGETGTQDDDELLAFIDAASQFVESIVGAVVRATKTQVVSPSRSGKVYLHHPAISLTSVVETYGGTVTLDAAVLTTQSPELAQGIVWLGYTRTTCFPLLVTYVAGRAVVPPLMRSATLDYLKWDWLSQRGSTPLPLSAAEEFSTEPGTIPYKIKQKLDPYTAPRVA